VNVNKQTYLAHYDKTILCPYKPSC